MYTNRHHCIIFFLSFIPLFLFIFSWLLWQNWSSFESELFIKESDITSDVLLIYYSLIGKTELKAHQIVYKTYADLFQILY